MGQSNYDTMTQNVHTALTNVGYSKIKLNNSVDSSESRFWVFNLEDTWPITITKIYGPKEEWFTSFNGQGKSSRSLDEVVKWYREETKETLQ